MNLKNITYIQQNARNAADCFFFSGNEMKCNTRAVYKKGRYKREATSDKNIMRLFYTNRFMFCLKTVG